MEAEQTCRLGLQSCNPGRVAYYCLPATATEPLLLLLLLLTCMPPSKIRASARRRKRQAVPGVEFAGAQFLKSSSDMQPQVADMQSSKAASLVDETATTFKAALLCVSASRSTSHTTGASHLPIPRDDKGDDGVWPHWSTRAEHAGWSFKCLLLFLSLPKHAAQDVNP